MSQRTRDEKAADARDAMHRLLEDRHLVDLKEGIVRIGPNSYNPELVVRTLDSVIGVDRKVRIDEILDGRTFNIATVVEGLANVGNAAAVMRTSEAFGFQNFHVIPGQSPYKRSDRTTQGADKWLDVTVWKDGVSCIEALRSDGYRIVATCLDESAKPIDTLDLSRKTALVFGNELSGISPEMKGLVDDLAIIEMPGFVESFNISVAAAITLYAAHRERTRVLGASGDLDPNQRALLWASFLARSTRHAANLLDAARNVDENNQSR